MKKIVQFNKNYKRSKEYREAIDEIAERLDGIEDEIQNFVVRLATTGKWKEWSDSMPVGAVFTFTEEMLRDTGDSNVDILIELRDAISEARLKIKK